MEIAMSFIDRVYDAVVRLGISEEERQIELNRLKAQRHSETTNIDSSLIAELSRGNVHMKRGLLKHRTQHEAELSEFMRASKPEPQRSASPDHS
jgi:hypothetical protein